MVMIGVVQGVSPTLEEAAQTLRADRAADLHDRVAAADAAGPGQRLPGRLHREHRRLRQPDRAWAASSPCCPPRSSSPSSARSTTRAAPPSLALILTLASRWRVFALQRGVLGRHELHHRHAARATPACRCRCPTACAALCTPSPCPWLAFTVVVYVFAFVGGFVQTWGRDYTPTLAHFTHRVRAGVGRSSAWSGRAPPGTRSSPR